MKKREFLLGGCAAAIGAATLTPSESIAALLRSSSGRLPDLGATPGLQAWQAFIGQDFEVGSGLFRERMSLHRIRTDGQPGPSEQFSLVFAGQSQRRLPAGIHVLQHSSGQRAGLYLEPIDSSKAGTKVTYLAHFNLLV